MPQTLVWHKFAPLALISLKIFPLHYYAEQISPCCSLQTVLDVFVEMEKKGLLSNTKLNVLHTVLKEVDQRLAAAVHDFMQRVRGIRKHVLTVIIIILSSLCLNGNSQANVLFSVVPQMLGTAPSPVVPMDLQVSRFTCVFVNYIIVYPRRWHLVYFFPITFSQLQFVCQYPRPSPEASAGIFSALGAYLWWCCWSYICEWPSFCLCSHGTKCFTWCWIHLSIFTAGWWRKALTDARSCPSFSHLGSLLPSIFYCILEWVLCPDS